MRNLDKQTTESVISACLIELGASARDYLSAKEECKKLFAETDWSRDLIAIFKAHDGSIFCAHFTDPGCKFRGSIIQCNVDSDFTTPTGGIPGHDGRHTECCTLEWCLHH